MLIGWLVALAFWQPQPASPNDLGALALVARQAFEQRRFERLFDERLLVRLELPDQPSAVSVRGRVAAAALGTLVRRTEDLAITEVMAAVVAPGHGYVELKRRYRVSGTQEEHTQRILISARLDQGQWRLVEIWISSADRGS
jgi:hypothetical protein